jgi:flagellar L-ring protein FlgH
MNNKKMSLLMWICLISCLVGVSSADSIWAKKDKMQTSLYADNTARQIGDVLTINISEKSTIDNKAKRELSKTTNRNQNFNGDVEIEHVIDELPAIKFGTGTAYSNTLSGKADFKDERAFTDSISVVVTDIMPNGNLVVFGTRDRNISDDIQTMEVSGIVRPIDIATNNSIESDKVADFSIVSSSKGIAAQYTKPNWLGRIMDVIWPF